MRTAVEVREEGLKALSDTLGLVDMVRFIQMYESGDGDSVKEKYNQPDFTLEEICAGRPELLSAL
jgi:hypothetical protein